MTGNIEKKLSEKIPRYELFRNIVLYGFFGGVAAFIDYSVFCLLTITDLISTPEIATLISNICGFIFTFTTNTFLNFKKTDDLGRRFISYGVICVIGIGISTLSISMFKNSMNLYILKGIVLVFVSAVQFVLNKLITYRG